jgi:AraC-like DNA-binding protein
VLRISDRDVSSTVEPTSEDRWEWIHAVSRGYDSDRVAIVLQQIADDLGLVLDYADAAAFTRAFRRWSGTTPAAWRAKQGAS